MSLNKRSKKLAATMVSLTDNDLHSPSLMKGQVQHEILYMIPSTKYQYELDGEKVLSHEHEGLPSSGNPSHYISGTTRSYQPTSTTTNLDDRYVVTPELTISSGNSIHHKVGITLVDNPVPPLDTRSKKKFSSLLILKLKAIFLFTNNNSDKKRQHY